MSEFCDDEFAGIPPESYADTTDAESVEDLNVERDMINEDYDGPEVDDDDDVVDDEGEWPDDALPSEEVTPPIVKQFYYSSDARPHPGDHPEPVIQDAIDDARHRVMENYDRLNIFLHSAPTYLNEQYEEVISQARADVAADFGPEAAEREISLLPPDQYEQAADFRGNGGDGTAFYAFGRVVTSVDPDMIRQYGERPLKQALRHQLAHGVGDNNQWSVAAISYGGGIPTIGGDEDIAHHIIRARPDYGWYSHEPDQLPDRAYLGDFLEEGAVEAWAIDKANEQDPEWARQFDDVAIIGPRGPGSLWGITYANRGVPIVSRGIDQVAMPWRYASGVQIDGDKGSVLTPIAAIPAYGIHLLESRGLTGIHQQILDSRTNPAVRQTVRERINGAGRYPGRPLHPQLTALPHTHKAFMRGVNWIIDGLRIGDEPVG